MTTDRRSMVEVVGTVLDRPWAIVYGPKCKLGTGLMYGLGLTRREAWENAALLMRGGSGDAEYDKRLLQHKGMIARRVVVMMED